MAVINLSRQDYTIDKQYYHYLNQFNKNIEVFQDENNIIDKDVLQGRTDYSVFQPDFMQFIFLVQTRIFTKNQSLKQNKIIDSTLNKQFFRISIKSVLSAIVVKYPDIGYVQGMNNIVCFLLCFASEITAFNLFCLLLEQIYPKNFFQKPIKGNGLIGYQASQHLIITLLKQFTEQFVSEDEQEQIAQFAQMKLPQFLICLFINQLYIQDQIQVMQVLFEKKDFDFIIDISTSIYCLHYNIVLAQIDESSEKLHNKIKQKIDLQNLFKFIESQSNSDLKKQIIDQFYENFSKKWNKSDKLTINQIKKFTQYEAEDIQKIQKCFLLFIENRKIYDENNTSNGLNKQEFKEFMNKISLNQHLQRNFFINQDTLDKVFDIFDDNKDNLLDFRYQIYFREFISGISMLTNSNIQQKIQMHFYIFDKNKANQLNFEEVGQLIDSFTTSLFRMIQISNLAQLSKQAQEFKEDFLSKRKNKYTLYGKQFKQDLYTMMNHEFIMGLDQMLIEMQYERKLLSQSIKDMEAETQFLKIKSSIVSN